MSAPIRRRLVIAVVAMTAPVLALGSYLLYDQVATTVRGQLDRELLAGARVLGDLAEHDEDGYEFELDPDTARVLAGEDATRVQLWDPDGGVLFRSPELERDLPRGEADSVRDVELGGRRYRAATIAVTPRMDFDDGAPAAGAARPLALAVARPTAGVDDTLAELRLWFLALTGLLLALSAVLVGRGVALGLAPLGRVRRDIDGLDAGHLDARVASDGVPGELLPLVATVNRLLARHQEAFVRERRFTADAAHELRTPLAVMRTEIEVALRKDRGAADYRGVLDGALRAVEDMTRTIDALLLIARADAGRVAVRTETVAVAPLVDESWRAVSAVAERRGVTLDVRVGAAALVTSDRALLRVLVGNLLSNVAHHAEPGVARVTSEPEAGLLIAVENRAAALCDDDLPHLFVRFWRRDAARTETAVHSGLGLSLVHALANCLELDVRAALEGDVLTMTVRTPIRGEPT